MSQTYLKIRNDYLKKAWARSALGLAVCLPAELIAEGLRFQAFGEECILTGEKSALPVKPRLALLVCLLPFMRALCRINLCSFIP